MNQTILKIKDLNFSYSYNKQWTKIVDDINIEIKKGSIIGIAGKSGCGKTTLAKILVNYFNLSTDIENKDYKLNGSVSYKHNKDWINVNSNIYNSLNPPPIQMVFQDPRTSLNMKMSLKEQLEESIKLNKNIKSNEIYSYMDSIANKYKIKDQLDSNSNPEELSGGQRRRFGLAKIVCCNPKIIIADEPVSSLDVSIKQEIMKVLFDLKKDDTTILVISHDISLLKNNADYIYIMDDKKIVEKWQPNKRPKSKSTLKLIEDSDFLNKHLNNLIK